MKMNNLTTIGGALNCHNNKEITEDTFPNLETVGGDIILAGSGFKKLPPMLNHVGGRGIVSQKDHPGLIEDLKRAYAKGIIKGGIFFCD